ncbi:MAG: DUF1294 domain-containing protein [Paludibacteraceae bacterium]|nr:DUF1294 domain-containing protein [Paludibacteraceae bacterium]
MTNAQFILLLLMIVNVAAFIIYAADKWLAKKNARRVPEKYLLLLAIIGGSVGAWSSMLLFRHKTKHWQFSVGVPLVLLLQIALSIYLISKT